MVEAWCIERQEVNGRVVDLDISRVIVAEPSEPSLGSPPTNSYISVETLKTCCREKCSSNKQSDYSIEVFFLKLLNWSCLGNPEVTSVRIYFHLLYRQAFEWLAGKIQSF